MFQYLSPKLYFIIDYNYLKVTFAGTGRQLQTSTDVALKENLCVALGEDVQNVKNEPGVIIKNGFTHPRIAIGDYDVAEQFLRYVTRKIVGSAFYMRPIAIVHFKRKLESGLSQVEERSLIDCFYSAGSREVYLWYGKDLTDQDILSGNVLKELKKKERKYLL